MTGSPIGGKRPGGHALRLFGAAALVAGLGLAAAGGASAGGQRVATGRVVFPVGVGTSVGGGARGVVALPSGGAVLVGGGGRGQTGFYAAELTATGLLDPGFGSGGIAHIGVDSPPAVPLEVLRQPDGKLVVVVSGRQTTAFSFGQLLVVRLNADGSLDRTFGSGGIVTTPVAPACEECTPAGLAPDGDIFVTGEAGQLSAALGGDPSAAATWTVAGLTASGGLDQGFGQGGLETIEATDAGGYDVSVLPSGEIMTLGAGNLSSAGGSTAIVTLLGPDGGGDRHFNGGVPVTLPTGTPPGAMLAGRDGSVVIGGRSALFGYTASGRPDAGFGDGGVGATGILPSPLQLLPAAGGGLLAVGRAAGAPDTVSGLRVTAAGRVDASLGGPAGIRLRPHFGGGNASVAGSRVVRPLAQNSFVERAVAVRPDGTYLAVGGVDVVAAAGGGRGRSRISEFAAAAITPGFTEDGGFGGRPAVVRLKLSIPAQSAVGAAGARGIRVRLDVSAAGLARVRIKAGGRMIAEGLVGILSRGPQFVEIGLTGYGASLLARRGAVGITATATARDLVTEGGRASASGTLG